MNLKDIRQAVADCVGNLYNPDNAGDVAALNRAINLGIKRTAQECPAAFTANLELKTPAQIDPPTGVTLQTTADDWVLKFAGASSHPAPIDGTGDGIYWVHIVLDDGTTVDYRVREFFTTVTGGVTGYYLSLEKPWQEGAHSGSGWATWNLIVPRLYLPENVRDLITARVRDAVWGNVTLQAKAQMDQWDFWPSSQLMNGSPFMSLRRDEYMKMSEPNKVPTYATDEGVWGDEPYGEFDYCYTYCWGVRAEKSPNGGAIPLWESSPSPVLEGVVIPNAFTVVDITVPKIDWQLNFGVTGTLRYTHSGVYIRIYRRRATVGGGLNSNIEAPDVFQFLVDVDGSAGVYTDDGSVVPDYHIRIPEIHGYYGWDIVPYPGSARTWVLNCRVKPPTLLNDYDAPMILDTYTEVLIRFSAASYCEMIQNVDLAQYNIGLASEAATKLLVNTSSRAVVKRLPNYGLQYPAVAYLRQTMP